MQKDRRRAAREVLLKRRGLVFVDSSAGPQSERLLKALEVELSTLGYALSTRLRAALFQSSLEDLSATRAWVWAVLAAELGAAHAHVPLFRDFPDGVPDDTHKLWMRRVLSHFLQASGQPCLFCQRLGTTHVLSPCLHVVCDQCFDVNQYSGCPVCGHKLDPKSPFLQRSSPQRQGLPREAVRFKLLDLGRDLDRECSAYFVRLCERKQALSPTDKADLLALVTDYGSLVLDWVPASIPVRENVALVFGTLLQVCPPSDVMAAAKGYVATATDVLRLVAAYSGADPSLQAQTTYRSIVRIEGPARWWGKIAAALGAQQPSARTRPVFVPIQLKRFRVAKLSRPLRRELLGLLDSFDAEHLAEDMLRHRSYWVWAGQFLHPHEYADRYPNAARAFAIARKKSPDGTRAPAFQGYYARLEAAISAGDSAALLELLASRPGELARRFDHALRVAGEDAAAVEKLLARFLRTAGAFSTPVLLTLRSHLPSRTHPASVRIFWPKGGVTKGVSSPDRRKVLPAPVLGRAVFQIEEELLKRFAAKGRVETCIIDTALREVIAPFNERTASPAAVALPRGSRIAVPRSKVVRMFIHWCEPERGGHTTDVDLSVGFYSRDWKHVGVCSYYNLKLKGQSGSEVALSSGDYTSAPYPDGSSEFIDLYRERALAEGMRYAVMVVNAYSGMPFSLLERAFAGLMLRDDVQGMHFDPRTVELKFSLQGANGVFLPLVFDLEAGTLHWLDVYSKGQLELNNVENSTSAITKICPEMIDYFSSGVRTTMFDLALLHGAARAGRVLVRGREWRCFERTADETSGQFLQRIRTELDAETKNFPAPVEPVVPVPTGPVLAVLYRGDLPLPENSAVYALFREGMIPNLS
ncbi:MAG TPA: MXAN_6230/SCO0854 family RING domain-containing protein, partial [Polyangiaceae bacterium]|nr:MXAN_6230/SCO0854 family RING domain-containing protein [Polyangiaceae bacterium]